MPEAEQHTLVVGCGPQPTSEWLFRGAARAGELLLIDQAAPTWQWDYIADADTAALDSTAALRQAALRLASRHGIGGVLAGSGAAVPAAAELSVLLIGGTRQDLCVDDAVLQTTLQSAALPVLPTLAVATAGEAVSAARAIGFPVVLKPANSHHRSAVANAESITSLVSGFHAIAATLGLTGKVLVQERADGPEYELLCSTDSGDTQVLATARHTMTGSWCTRSGATASPADPLTGQLAGLARRVTESLGIDRGMTSITIRLLPTGPHILSVHVHLPFDRAALFAPATGRDIAAAAAALQRGDGLPAHAPRPAHFAAERVLRAPRAGTLETRAFRPPASSAGAFAQIRWHTPVGGSIAARAPVCTVTASGPTRATCDANLAEALAATHLRITAPPR